MNGMATGCKPFCRIFFFLLKLNALAQAYLGVRWHSSRRNSKFRSSEMAGNTSKIRILLVIVHIFMDYSKFSSANRKFRV